MVNAESEAMKQVEDVENKSDDHLEDDGKKKKHRKEKIGFRDRKVFSHYFSCFLSTFF